MAETSQAAFEPPTTLGGGLRPGVDLGDKELVAEILDEDDEPTVDLAQPQPFS